MKKLILAILLITSLSFGGLFKAEDDMKTHVAIGTMTSVWANLFAKKNGATDVQAFFLGVGAAMVVGAIASDGNMDLGSDAIGGALGSSISYTIYKW